MLFAWLLLGGVAMLVIHLLARLQRTHTRDPDLDKVSATWLKERWFEESIRDRRM